MSRRQARPTPARGLPVLLLSVALCAISAWMPARAAQPATPDATPQPLGDPEPGKALRDRDFGVVTHQFGLDRVVEMYQWRAEGAAYTRVWNAAPIDSSGFAPGHDNPRAIPLDGHRWWSNTATLDGKPLDRAVLQGLGEWRVFRPNFSRLPANLAASFQPEGDGLGSAENPLDPQIGDLRVRWRELHLPPLAGRVEWRGGAWRLKPDALLPPKEEVEAEDAPAAAVASTPLRIGLMLGGSGLIVAVLLMAFVRLRRRKGRGAA